MDFRVPRSPKPAESLSTRWRRSSRPLVGSGSPVSTRELSSLTSKGREIGCEHRVKKGRLLDSGRSDNFAELEATEAGGDDVLGTHPRHRAEIHPLRGVWNSVATTPGQTTCTPIGVSSNSAASSCVIATSMASAPP